MIDIKLPSLAEGVDSATVTYCHKGAGEHVKEGDDLIELVTDKATFNMPSPASGVLKEILVSEGDQVKVGQIVARIE
ncbi:MAG: lipoyl domain-containing protein [Candidatus Omnitrophica bacterium]|nr:lipoyl domain-containing protein [Candidatus Omnitrophota bacterium]